MVEKSSAALEPGHSYEGFFFLGRTKTVANHSAEIKRLVEQQLGIDPEKVVVTVTQGQFPPVRKKARALAESIVQGKILVIIESPDGFFLNDAVVYEDEVCGTIVDTNPDITCERSIVISPLSNQLGPRPKGKPDLLDRVAGPWGAGLVWLCIRAIGKKIPLDFIWLHRSIPRLVEKKIRGATA